MEQGAGDNSPQIQILGLRDYTDRVTKKPEKGHAFFHKSWRANSLAEIFESPDDLLADVPPHEQYNLYYTVANCLEEPGRKLAFQRYLPIDIDNIDVDMAQEVIKSALGVLELEFDDAYSLFSGNGVQILLELDELITDVSFFKKYRRAYRTLCDSINDRLEQHKLKGHADPSVFSSGRLMRMPNTMNRKPNKPERKAEVYSASATAIPNPLERFYEEPRDTINNAHKSAPPRPEADHLRSWPTPDTKAILHSETGCLFLNYTKTSPNEVSEPEWHAMIDMLVRLPGGDKLALEYSRGYKGFNDDETNQKIAQLEARSPSARTCENVDSLWGKCNTCPHFNSGIKSYIQVKGSEDYIETEDTGFWNFIDGKRKDPNYDDLLKKFKKDFEYKSVDFGMKSSIYIYNGKYWSEMTEKKLKAWVEDVMFPKPKEVHRKEFLAKISANNVVDKSFLTPKSVSGKINLNNGVYDISKSELLPHSPDFGFKTVIPYDYDKDADCPTYDHFMKQVTGDDDVAIACIDEYFAYTITQVPAEKGQKALFLFGDGSNGKSTLLNVFQRMLGSSESKCYTAQSLRNLNTNGNAVYSLINSIANFSSESSFDALNRNELFKQIIAGDLITGERKYFDPVEFVTNAKLFVSTNQMPANNDQTFGLYRRILLIKFDQEFSEELGNIDRDIHDKLVAEIPGIINRIIKAYNRLKKNKWKFSESEGMLEALEEYRKDNDPIKYYFSECCRELKSGEIHMGYPNDAIYSDFREFCSNENIKAGENLKKKTFSTRFNRMPGVKKYKGTFKNKRPSVFTGFILEHNNLELAEVDEYHDYIRKKEGK